MDIPVPQVSGFWGQVSIRKEVGSHLLQETSVLGQGTDMTVSERSKMPGMMEVRGQPGES